MISIYVEGIGGNSQRASRVGMRLSCSCVHCYVCVCVFSFVRVFRGPGDKTRMQTRCQLRSSRPANAHIWRSGQTISLTSDYPVGTREQQMWEYHVDFESWGSSGINRNHFNKYDIPAGM